MKIRNLDTFYWIASLQSFRAAAEKLNLTQPAVTTRIHMLEQDLGTEVFLREVRNAQLTPAGRLLLPFAEQLMALEQDVLATFANTTKIKQKIRLGSSETIVSTWLPDFLSQLSTSQPGHSFDLTVDSTDNLRNALVAREIDIAFLMGPVAEVSVTNTDLCAFEMVFAAAPRIASRCKGWSTTDVASQKVLTFAQNTKPSRQLRELLAPHTTDTLDMTTSSSLGALVRLAKTGYGICAMPRAVITPELQNGELRELPINFDIPSISFTASYISTSPVSRFMSDIADKAGEFLQPKLTKNTYHA